MRAEALLTWFDEMNSVQRELLSFAESKKKTIIENNMSELDSIIKGEQKCLLEMRNLENKRVAIVQSIMQGRATGSNAVISDILAVLEGEEKEALVNKVTELAKMIQQIKILNQENDILLKQSLQFINRTIAAVQPVRKQTPGTYSATGKVKLEKNSGGFTGSV